ncbi:NmrA family transcriptional regulator [Nocardiopsis kunsanensis]|uniref:NmrA family transcriptional regulator n=1 Tax=Nocardiopsis kunsanensis TaxID=141693 RepID=A0A918X9T9_9ACTN|nr:SDR family oxidoreductase [Nocardiopsis kunsanensis]GHD19510.1 NmrA family transcriptional regulator [Nocardiopsis kunsanensis]
MIVVTGATGALNGATVEHLLARLPADRVGVSVRDVAKARHFADRGVRVRQGSYEDPAALRASFEGADQVLLVSGNDPAADMVGLHRNAIDAAVAAGVRRILYTSQQGAAHGGPYPPAAIHAATEEILAASGVAWTSLRYGFFAHSFAPLLGPWQESGVIAAPKDGPVPWTAPDDLSEATAVVLSGDRSFDGAITLIADEALTLEDFAGIASALSDRTIERVVVDDEQWVADQVADGVPEPAARFTLTMFRATREGYFAQQDPLLAELLDREPRSVADRLAEQIGL